MRVFSAAFIWFASGLFLGAGCRGAGAQTAPSAASNPGKATPYPELGAEIVEIVRSHFFDAVRADAWAAAHRDYAAHTTDSATFEQQTQTALKALHASHTGYYRPTDAAYYGLLSVFEAVLRPEGVWYDSIGVDCVRQSEGYFVRVVFAGSPAEKSGLRRGDLLLSADGAPFAPVASFLARSGQAVTLRVQRDKAAAPFAVVVTPRHV